MNLVEILLLWLSYWILFQRGGNWVEEHLHIQNAAGNPERRTFIFVFNIIIFIRLAYGMIFLVRRRIPWEESISVPFAFALYYVGFTLFVLPVSKQIDAVDYIAMAVFITGCILNSVGEILRNQWKKKPENKGKIYTKGFFKYSRHINYFGDILWVSAYAILTRNIWSMTIPVLLFFFFAFYNAPKLDQYLAEKYGKEYDEYARKTKMLIPYIF